MKKALSILILLTLILSVVPLGKITAVQILDLDGDGGEVGDGGNNECPSGYICLENPLEAKSFEDILKTIVDFIFVISIPIATVMIMVAAFFFLTAAGDPERVSKAKQIILWTLIGLAIILFAKGLISVLREIIEVKKI